MTGCIGLVWSTNGVGARTTSGSNRSTHTAPRSWPTASTASSAAIAVTTTRGDGSSTSSERRRRPFVKPPRVGIDPDVRAAAAPVMRARTGARLRATASPSTGAKRLQTRLELLERIYDPALRRQLGFVKGEWRCFEIGAGRGSMVTWLTKRVAATGRAWRLISTSRTSSGPRIQRGGPPSRHPERPAQRLGTWLV